MAFPSEMPPDREPKKMNKGEYQAKAGTYYKFSIRRDRVCRRVGGKLSAGSAFLQDYLRCSLRYEFVSAAKGLANETWKLNEDSGKASGHLNEAGRQAEILRGLPGETDPTKGAPKTHDDAIKGSLNSKPNLMILSLPGTVNCYRSRWRTTSMQWQISWSQRWIETANREGLKSATFIEDSGSYEQPFLIQKALSHALVFAIFYGCLQSINTLEP